MKKKAMLFVFAFMFMTAQANAESYRVMVVPNGAGTGVEQEVFFDYEQGVWHGAPVKDMGNLSAWADIDSSTHKLKLQDGGELVVQNNRPALRKASGEVSPL